MDIEDRILDLAIHYTLNNNYPQSQRSSPST